MLRWLKDGTGLFLLARGSQVSIATAYRYLHEALNVTAARLPDLLDVLEHGHAAGWEYVCSDGNVQVLTGPTGYPVWVSPVEPGSTHEITAARNHVLPGLYPAASRGLPTLTDKGYTGAGLGILVPDKGRDLHVDNLSRNKIIGVLRAPAERVNALLKSTWKALHRVTLDPNRITVIVAASLVLLHMQRRTWRENLSVGLRTPICEVVRGSVF